MKGTLWLSISSFWFESKELFSLMCMMQNAREGQFTESCLSEVLLWIVPTISLKWFQHFVPRRHTNTKTTEPLKHLNLKSYPTPCFLALFHIAFFMMTFRKIPWPTAFGNPEDVWNPRMFGPSDIEPDENPCRHEQVNMTCFWGMILHGYMYSWCIQRESWYCFSTCGDMFQKASTFQIELISYIFE